MSFMTALGEQDEYPKWTRFPSKMAVCQEGNLPDA